MNVIWLYRRVYIVYRRYKCSRYSDMSPVFITGTFTVASVPMQCTNVLMHQIAMDS